VGPSSLVSVPVVHGPHTCDLQTHTHTCSITHKGIYIRIFDDDLSSSLHTRPLTVFMSLALTPSPSMGRSWSPSLTSLATPGPSPFRSRLLHFWQTLSHVTIEIAPKATTTRQRKVIPVYVTITASVEEVSQSISYHAGWSNIGG